MLTQRVPFAGKNVAKVITAVVAKGHRPGYLDNEEALFPPGLTKLIDVCWTQDPAVCVIFESRALLFCFFFRPETIPDVPR